MKKYSGITVIIILAFAVFAAGINVYKNNRNNDTDLLISANSLIVADTIPKMYGIPVDSFYIEAGNVQRNQTLGNILQKYSLPDGRFNQLLLYAGNVFDVRKIRTGNNYTVFLSPDTLMELQYFVYEHTPEQYIVFNFIDSLRIEIQEKEVELIKKAGFGRIDLSLWESMYSNNINPLVALELSDIYAWTIDFFSLQKEDSFSVIYNERYIDSIAVGLEDIYAAYFKHGGKELYAIPFMQDSVLSFFDADGNSLKRAFLKAPLRYNRISSRYSSGRLHPILRIVRPHYGVDYAAPTGTPVYTVGDGVIIETSYDSGSGNIVKVRHNSVYTSYYMHLSGFASGIRAGVYIKQGDLIGYVGSTGLSTGPHLDFRVYMNGSPIDPLKMESPPVDPIKPENKMAFDSVKNEIIIALKNIAPVSYQQEDLLSEMNLDY